MRSARQPPTRPSRTPPCCSLPGEARRPRRRSSSRPTSATRTPGAREDRSAWRSTRRRCSKRGRCGGVTVSTARKRALSPITSPPGTGIGEHAIVCARRCGADDDGLLQRGVVRCKGLRPEAGGGAFGLRSLGLGRPVRRCEPIRIPSAGPVAASVPQMSDIAWIFPPFDEQAHRQRRRPARVAPGAGRARRVARRPSR